MLNARSTAAHHYFRDSGMIPWLLVAELGPKSVRPLADWFAAFPSSGETNFRLDDAGTAINRVLAAYRGRALSIDETDGVSLAFSTWRFNLRCSNTEPLVRLNIESRGGSDSLVARVADLLGEFRV